MTTKTFYKGFQIIKSGNLYKVWFANQTWEYRLLREAKAFIDDVSEE